MSATMTAERPERGEAAEYYFTYIDQVPDGDICRMLRGQLDDTITFLEEITEERSLYRYAADKWSIRQVIGHVNDTERLFLSRAFWFARGFDSPLPSFDQNIAVAAAESDERSLRSHIHEFRAIRSSTLAFFETLPSDAWMRRGLASGNPFTVRALAWLAVGHVTHHAKIVRERYL
jgi:uncharacterized damage-inducible protein DinB